MKRIVIAGGTGFLGKVLIDYYKNKDASIAVLTRGLPKATGAVRYVNWNARTQGAWCVELEGADMVINLTGKSVDCRYNEKNKALIYSSRIDSTNVIGEAIKTCKVPPKLWINSASATIYRHSLDKEMDEYTGEMGSGFSVDVCQKWEAAFNNYITPFTRKVIIRTGIVLGKQGGPLKPLMMLARMRVGGKHGDGRQYVSWLHEADFAAMVDFIFNNPSMEGIYNLTSPEPIPNENFMNSLRNAMDVWIGLNLPTWLLKMGAVLIQTEPELILKSRRVVPKRLLEAGYQFQYPSVDEALKQLVS